MISRPVDTFGEVVDRIEIIIGQLVKIGASKRRAYACQECGYHIYPCAGTIFHKSRTNLTKWFFAMYLMTSTRHGVAAKEIERQLGVTYKCAWRICHELRKLMTSADHGGMLSGHVEVDETWVGGVRRKGGKGQGKRRSKKVIVMGMIERDGKVRAGPVPDDTKFTMEPVILENVEWGSIVTSDGHRSYSDLGMTYQHRDQSRRRRICSRRTPHEYYGRPLGAAKALNPRNSHSYFSKTRLEIYWRVQLPQKLSALSHSYV